MQSTSGGGSGSSGGLAGRGGRAATLIAMETPSAAGKRFHLTTFGCQMNEHDSERMKGML